MDTLTKEEWIAEVYRLLCISQAAAPGNATHEKNLREYAAAIYDAELEWAELESRPIVSPQEAHDEELSAGA